MQKDPKKHPVYMVIKGDISELFWFLVKGCSVKQSFREFKKNPKRPDKMESCQNSVWAVVLIRKIGKFLTEFESLSIIQK